MVFCSWLLHRSDKCICISSWKGSCRSFKDVKTFLNWTQQFRVWCWYHRWQEMVSFLPKQLRTIAFVVSTKITLCLWLLFHPLRGWVWLNQGRKYAYILFICKILTQITLDFWFLPSLSESSRIRAEKKSVLFNFLLWNIGMLTYSLIPAKTRRYGVEWKSALSRLVGQGSSTMHALVINIKLWSGQFLSQ